ncbi:MAG: hypothetical protein HOP33_21150 [Verrucomicrobia bacterium]|nr:hypothetical protein [Verrucomicrobiota bacterium]
MKKLIALIVSILCPMLVLVGCATNNIAPVASNGGFSAKELSAPNRAMVTSRLEKVGYSKEEAIARADQMSDDEIAYFAQHPESIRRSGFVILASCIGSSVYSSINNGNKKREAYISHLKNKIAELRTEITLTDSKRVNQRTLLAVEQDAARKAELEAESKRLGNEIDSKQDQIKSLESDIQLVNTKKKKVPNKKDW